MSKEQKNSEGQKMPTWAIVVIVGLSVILLSLIIWIITHKVDSIDLGTTITVENWFSFLVTLIGVIITLFVGLQIFNAVEIRRELKDAEGKYEELKNNTEQFKEVFLGFKSNLEQEMVKFKLEILGKYNDAEVKLLKEQSENTQKIDGYLKENEKEYRAKLEELKESIAESEQTQEDIKKEMGDILDKWKIINEKLNESQMSIGKSLLVLVDTYPNNEIKIYLILSAIEIIPDIEDRESGLIDLLDVMTTLLDKIDKFKDASIQNEAKCLRNIHLDKLKNKEDIEKKINKILYLIDEKTISAEGEGQTANK